MSSYQDEKNSLRGTFALISFLLVPVSFMVTDDVMQWFCWILFVAVQLFCLFGPWGDKE